MDFCWSEKQWSVCAVFHHSCYGPAETRRYKNGRAKFPLFIEIDSVLLSTVKLPRPVVTYVGNSKRLSLYFGPFRVLRRQGNVYTIEMPHRVRTYPTFYVGRLRSYCQYELSSDDEDSLYI